MNLVPNIPPEILAAWNRIVMNNYPEYHSFDMRNNDLALVGEALGQLGALREGLGRALKLLGRAECENCGLPLAELPRASDCPDFSHVDTATQFAELGKLLPSK